MNYILVADAGTGSCRVILFDEKGQVAASAQIEYAFTEDASIEGSIVFDPDRFFHTVLSCMKETIRQAEAAGIRAADIRMISATSQREGMVYLDALGKELYSAPSMDLRGGSVLSSLKEHEREIFRTTGLPLHGMFGLARLCWFRRFDPDTYRNLRTVLMLSDWIAYRLTGVKASEASIASSSQLFDVTERGFALELLDRLGFRTDIFPPLVQAGTPIGDLKPEIAAELGLPETTGVSLGGSDTHAGMVGIGAITPGDVGVIAGTTTPVLQVLDRPFLDPFRRLFLNCHAAEHLWTCESNGGSTGLSQRWAKRILLDREDGAASYEAMDLEAQKALPGASGMVAYIGAELAGGRSGENLGGFLFPVPWNIEDIRRADFLRAVVETNAYTVKANLDLICAGTKLVPKQLLLSGGQSRSALFVQILADVTGLPVKVFRIKESTALGAAILSFTGIGRYPDLKTAMSEMIREDRTALPEPEHTEHYADLYARWRTIHQRLNGESGGFGAF